jgi:hypothetical protein
VSAQLGRDRSRPPAEREQRRRKRSGKSAYRQHYSFWERWYLAHPEYTDGRFCGMESPRESEMARYVRWLWKHRPDQEPRS